MSSTVLARITAKWLTTSSGASLSAPPTPSASFDAVDKCYAVQAGREIRIIVNPKKISDEESYDLARQVARKIEDELQYPGHIRVTMVRENRFVEYAK